MDAWELALTKINELLLNKRLKASVPSKEGMRFFECDKGQFALEVPRRTRGVKGAKFWFSFPPKVPDEIHVETKGPGDGRNNKLNTTPGSRMGKGVGCWSVLITNSQPKAQENIHVILSELNGSTESSVPLSEASNGVQPGNEFDGKVWKPDPAIDVTVSEADQKGLESDTASLSTSEREAVVKVRFGQGGFRSSLLDIAGEVCWMSGIEGKELLIASHIQPWAHSEKNPEARGCPDNGLLLSSLWDAAFDAGLMTFDEDWRVIPSPMLSESAKKHLGLQEERYLPEEFRNPRRAEYLAYHRLAVFKR